METIALKKTDMRCPYDGCAGFLREPAVIGDNWKYVPVKCDTCSFTGRRVNLIVIPDDSGDSWAPVDLI